MLKTKLGKRVLTFGLAAVVVLGMAIPAFAAAPARAATDDKLTKPGSDPYTYRIASDRVKTATLRVGPANDDYTFMGWATSEAASAATVEWTVTQGADLVTVGAPSIVPVKEGTTVVGYAYQVQVSSTADRAKYGVANVHAAWTNAPNPSQYGATMDFSINVDSYSQQKARTGVIVDLQIDDKVPAMGFETYADNVKVVASGSYTENNPLHNTTAAQTYSTPLGALVELIKPTGVTAADYDSHIQGMTVFSDGTYLNSVNGYYLKGSTVMTSDRPASGWDGWTYRVYRGTGNVKTMVPESAYVGSSGLPLQDNDVVMWRYGSFIYPATYTVQ